MSAVDQQSELRYVPAAGIRQIISENRAAIVNLVADTYLAFYAGECLSPDTYSLTFPQKPGCRINALPAYVGRDVDRIGIKWVGSFPQNSARGLQRASAVIVLNSFDTGYPVAVLDGALISAARTAASAALGARLLRRNRRADVLRMFGAGVINRTIVEFLMADDWAFGRISIVDPDPMAAESLRRHIARQGAAGAVFVDGAADGPADMLCFATSELTPWYDAGIGDDQVVLHISLRDIVPDRLRGVRNVVDNIDNALKANTSLHLLERRIGRTFSLVNYGDLMNADRHTADEGGVVAPFGMGMLDVALADFVLKAAELNGLVRELPGFLSETSRI